MRPLLLTCLLVAALPALAADPSPVPVADALHAGPVVLHLPAFHEAERAGVEVEDLLDAATAVPGDGWPAAGERFPGPDGGVRSWSGDRPTVDQDAGDASLTWTAFYVASDRWQKARLRLVSDGPARAALDGADLELSRGEGDTLDAELTLERGKHLVVLRRLGGWPAAVTVTPDSAAGDGTLAVGTDPARHADIRLVLDTPRLSDVSLSPDGARAALVLGEYRDGEHRETWLEVRATDGGDLLDLWRGDGTPSGLRWLDTGNRLSWSTETDGKATIWLRDLDAGTMVPVVQDVEHMGAWRWAPDGSFVVYEIRNEPEPDPRKVKRVDVPADRQPWWRNRTHLEQVFWPGGVVRRLTAGPVSPESWRIAPDGGSLLFFLSEQDLARRPYFTSELWLLDLEDLDLTRLLDDPWIGGAEWSPDGGRLLLSGSPSAFDGLGRNLPEGVQANDYGGQLYLWDLDTRQPTAVSRDLRPDVVEAAWCRADGRLYARCTDTQFTNVYRSRPGGAWERVETGLGATAGLALPVTGRTAVAWGTSVSTPNRVHTVDLGDNRAALLHDPGAGAWEDVRFGDVKPFVATLPGGEELDGRVYYPPGYDADGSYPVIVYYYGGTSPVGVDFGGRYPKNVWAAQGYLVYVPEPSGATGYGQAMAARHVNDWGRITAGEVIEGTKSFLAAHPAADADHVGCIGASYGGFLTEYLVTQTDMFAAAVSHAGISSISSYWGEGFWGYAYGARALADAFPWQDQDLYVGQSPLFLADRITTPLLLLHGDSDTNVPKGESDQLFTALKLLGRDVEYVQIQGQDHWVLDHDQRIVWNDTILAYFARHLKGLPAWWDALYPAPQDWR